MTSFLRSSLLFVCVTMCVIYVSANSSGLGLPCNVDNPYLGNTPRIMDSATQHASGRNMTWSLRPVFAGNLYTLRSGDGAAGTDPTSYVPNQYTTITIRATAQDQQFTGLLMYAVNSAGVRVGSWLIAPRQSFQIDPASGCVTHSNAEVKNYKNVFRVKFPPGTGTVTIKALVKYGRAFPEAMGAFYWPNDAHLQLTEGAAVQQQWFQGNVGESCNVVCAQQNMGCDLATLQSAGTQASLLQTVQTTTACFGPMMTGCGASSPTFGTEGCFYHDPTCTRAPVQFDPCAGTPAYVAGTVYNPQNGQTACATYQDPAGVLLGGLKYKWCAQFYTTSAPSGGTNQPGNPWFVFNQCAPAGGYPQAGGPARAAVANDCSSVKTVTDDGNRLCACSNGMPVSTATDPPLPNTPAPTAPPMSGGNGNGNNNNPTPTPSGPTLPTCTNPPATPAPATTAPVATNAPATSAPITKDSIVIFNGPTSIPASGSFQVQFQYSAVGARSLVADILLPSQNYAYFGGGFTNVNAGTSGYATVTATIQNNPTPATNYIINYWMVDQAIYKNGQNTSAWKGTTQYQFTVAIVAGITPPTAGPVPTSAPTSAPADNNGQATNPPAATSAPTDPTPDTDCVPPNNNNPSGSGTPAPGGKINMASTASPSLLLSILSLGMAGITSRGSSMLVMISAILMVCAVPGISAHNWLSSPARGNMGGLGQFNGNTVPPCPPKTSRVHVQVAAGQRFPVEWASGHGFGSFTYLTLLKASDEASLSIISTTSGSGSGGSAALDDYLAGGTNNYMPDEKCIHINPTGQSASTDTSLNFASATATTALLKPLRATNVFRQDNVNNAAMTFYNKTAAATAGDIRVQYFNPKYPFIISAHKFALNEDRPDAMDWTMMEIPAGFPPGQYIIQYQWRGYFDCVDINVLDKPVVTDVWGHLNGDPNGKKSYDKYHHTLYTPYLQGYGVGKCTEIPEGSDISACASLCEQNQITLPGGQNVPCDSLTVAPAQLNTIVKFPGLQKSNSSHLPAACDNTIATLKAPMATAQVCFTQKSGLPPLVGPAFKTVFDPEDPTFYMTTYIQKAPWIFADVCSVCIPPQPTSDFRFNDQCISCVDMQRNFFTTLPPRWTIQGTCQDCNNLFG